MTNTIKLWTLLAAGIVCTAAACEGNAKGGDSGSGDGKITASLLAEQNLRRAMQITDSAVRYCFEGNAVLKMLQHYNPYTSKTEGVVSIWGYTASVEAVNAVLHGLKAYKDAGSPALYDAHYQRYADLLAKLYDNADYYLGSFLLTSYTQTKMWHVYAVNRAAGKGSANVACKENVYDDQEWFIRELIESYKLTGKEEYLEKAEYLTDYVLDGWYRTETTDGGNKGGIPWGPGYTSKHTCSNGPMISPLVWLYEIYKDKPDEITCKTIDAGGARIERTEAKKDYYLNTAKMLYGWTKANLLRSDGLYHDATWTDDPRSSDGYCCEGSGAEGSCIPTETAGGVLYRKPSVCVRPGGSPLSYNIGSVLSGAADLYRVTKDGNYLTDAEALSQKSFAYFAKPNATKQGYDTWAIDGFNNWFNGVLMRAYVDAYPFYSAAAEYAGSFQKNLDYGYDNYLYRGFLPTNLLLGWGSNAENRKVNAHFIFAFAAEYAVLAKLELMKGQ